MGRYHCDCPPILIETMLKRLNQHLGKQDVIFLTGDFAAHHVAMHHLDSPNTYGVLLDTFKKINEMQFDIKVSVWLVALKMLYSNFS